MVEAPQEEVLFVAVSVFLCLVTLDRLLCVWYYGDIRITKFVYKFL